MADDSPKALPPRRVLLGEIGPAHGVRGEVLIRAYTADAAAIASYGPLTDASGRTAFTLKVVRVTDKGVVARIFGVADRNRAEALRGTELYVDRDRLPKPAASEFYHVDLIGLDAVLENGAAYGRIIAVQNFGAGDLLEVARVGAETEFIPFTIAHAPTVDFETRRVSVVPPTMVGEPEPADGADQD
ncbi:MAG: ribosome maturation factor RimM [Hyphomicrobium sp.]